MSTDRYPVGRDGRPVALEARDEADDGRRRSPSVARNTEPIIEAFKALMPDVSRVLEVASGTGEHGMALTAARPGLHWTFSDPDEEARVSIAAWMASAKTEGRLAGPLRLDMIDESSWRDVDAEFDAVVCINMIHIAPIEAGDGLFRLAAQRLAVGGRVFLYGPFGRQGEMAESNRAFDASLKSRDPHWGVRDLDDEVVPLAARLGLTLVAVREMPANNLSVAFRRG